MGLKGKLIAEVEVKSSADDFHHQWRHKPHHISSFSELVDDCELHEGDYGQPGVTICWRYMDLSGKSLTSKQKVEFVDETRTIVFTVIGGELLDVYKSLVATLVTIPGEGPQTNLVRWTIDYEKIHEDAPHPVLSLEVLLNVSKHVEVEHIKKG